MVRPNEVPLVTYPPVYVEHLLAVELGRALTLLRIAGVQPNADYGSMIARYLVESGWRIESPDAGMTPMEEGYARSSGVLPE